MSEKLEITDKFQTQTLTVDTSFGGRFVEIEIDSPWQGSTEEGFGATLKQNLSPRQVLGLAAYLSTWLVENNVIPESSKE